MYSIVETLVRDNIRKLIESKGYKQKFIAEKAGFSENEFSQMLCGNKRIRVEHIPQIAKALDAEPNDLFNANKSA